MTRPLLDFRESKSNAHWYLSGQTRGGKTVTWTAMVIVEVLETGPV